MNVDATGIAWWQEGDPRPLRYVTERTPWGDANLPALAPRLRAGTQVPAVRSATPGIPHGPGLVAPFTSGRLAGVHNGWLADFRRTLAAPLLDRLPGHLRAEMEAMSDSHALFLTAVARLGPDGGETGLAEAVASAVGEVAGICGREGLAATLNLAVCDGERLIASRASAGAPVNTLYTLDGGTRWPDGVVLASEPLDDDPGWTSVPEGCVVELSAAGVARHPIGG